MKQSLLLSSSLVVLSLALVIDRASAWTLPHSSTATVVIGDEHNRRLFLLRRSTLPLQATNRNDGDNNIDDDNDVFHDNSSRSRNRRNFIFHSAAFFFATSLLLPPPRLAWASGGGGSVKRDPSIPIIPLTTNELISKLSLWLGIFIALALLHAAEIAITTLYPWKVREFAEEEEKLLSNEGGKGSSHDGRSKNDKRSRKQRRGTFQTLNEDITRVLTTILVTSTACSIYATTLFTHLSDHIFGIEWASKWSAVFLTGITLFFVELLPKNIGVINAERVARLMVPPINVLANAVGPFGYALSYLAKSTLRLFGVQAKEETGVSDSELRLIVTGARDSGTIDHSEQEMIKGVLNLQDRKVRSSRRGCYAELIL